MMDYQGESECIDIHLLSCEPMQQPQILAYLINEPVL